MNDPFAQNVRRAATGCLPAGAFLKRDRREALFITNALRVSPGPDWISPFREAGFIAAEAGGLIRLWPDQRWFEALEGAFSEAPDHLCKSLVRFKGMPPDDESIALFALGLRILDGDPDCDYENRLRRRAAVALRTTSGGGLYACALVNHMIRKELEL